RGEGGRRNTESGDEMDLVVDDQFLREALGVVGNRAVVLEDDLDLLAGDGVALLLHVKLNGVVDLLAGRRLPAGHRQDQADLHGFLRLRWRQSQDRAQRPRNCNADRGPRQPLLAIEHERSPLIGFVPRTECPALCTIAQIFQPCTGAAWRLKPATMSIATMGAMAGAAGYRFVVVSLGIKLRNDE